MEYLAGQMILSPKGIQQIGQGAKNIVCGSNSKFVLRVCFCHDGSCELTVALSKILPKLLFSPSSESLNLSRLIKQCFAVTNLNRPFTDFSSCKSVMDEQYRAALISTVPNKMWGSTTAILHQQCVVKIFEQDDQTTISDALNEKFKLHSCIFTPDLRMNVEIGIRFDGSLKAMANLHKKIPQFSALDLLEVPMSKIHDLQAIFKQLGWFPTDGHTDNILTNRVEDAVKKSLHDFGITSDQHGFERQFNTSFQDVIFRMRESAKSELLPDSYRNQTKFYVSGETVSAILAEIQLPSPNENYAQYFTSVLSAIQIHLNPEQRLVLWQRIGSSDFAVSDLSNQVAELRNELNSQRIEFDLKLQQQRDELQTAFEQKFQQQRDELQTGFEQKFQQQQLDFDQKLQQQLQQQRVELRLEFGQFLDQLQLRFNLNFTTRSW
jgi:hypothetical protein